MSEDKKTLTDEDKDYIRKNWDKVELIELTKKVSGNPDADGRHAMGKIIAAYVVEVGGTPISTKYKKMDMELTQTHKDYIKNNYKNSSSVFEIAKSLFPDKRNLTALNKETLLVQEYIKSFDPEAIKPKDELSTSSYRAPQSVKTLLFKVVKYVTKFSTGEAKAPDIDSLTELEKRNLNALLSYINTHRFISQINRYMKEEDRDTFEDCFIRYTYDKPDLLQEDLDQYIVMCDEIVSQGKIQRTIEILDMQIVEALESEKGAKSIPHNVVELVNAQREKLNTSRKRVDDASARLVTSRAKRYDNKLQENANILNLVSDWQNEKMRLQLIEIAKEQKTLESDEVDKLSDMDGVIARIAGFSKERARH